jgi:polysaccharide chain length determinant protein (PEP-CTERM system associated)
MAALSHAVSRLRTDLAAAEQSRDAYRRALSSEEPQLPVELAANVAVAPPSDLDVRLSTQKKSLDDLLRRYTEQHPDVISARRTIAQLEAQKRRELDTRVHSPDRRSAATSPVYQQLRVALAEAEAQVASLRAKLNAQQTQLNQTRAVASRVPQVESDLAQLNRDYDIIRKNYDMLVARRESASLGVKMDESSQLADFRVVEPPRVDPKPVFPSRIALGVLAVLVSLVSGIAVVIGLDRLRPTFHEIRSLQEATRRPVLGTVSVSGGALANAGGQALRFVGAVAGLLVLQILWLAWLATHASLL